MDDWTLALFLIWTSWITWVAASAAITVQFLRAIYYGFKTGKALPFIFGSVFIGIGNIIETSITLYAAYNLERLGEVALYALLGWPIIRAVGFITCGLWVFRDGRSEDAARNH